jgi:superfamily II DNA or RNA helicase
MKNLPKIIDNNRKILKDTLVEVSKDFSEISIATGYWDLEGMKLILPQIEGYSKIRILIGREPMIARYQLMVPVPEPDYPDKDFKYDLSMLTPDSSLTETVAKIKELIEKGTLEVRVYRKNFLHAKCYIFGSYTTDTAIGIIGSSNFTKNGLTQNTELNALESDHRIVLSEPKTESQEVGHLFWFDSFWNDETTEKWNEEFSTLLGTSPVGDELYSPYETYIKTLYELYKEEVEDDGEQLTENGQGKALFDFQQKNVHALLRRLRKHKVAMLADSVGLGKTTTAISVLKQYIDNPEGKKRVEIICPKSLVQQWEKELATEGVYGLKPITLQNTGEIERRKELDNIASVSLFIIDESHNLRQTSGSRFKLLLEWVRSNPKAQVLLLTATPINNQLSDLTNQILLGTGGDAEVLKVTIADEQKQTVQLSFYQAVENLKKKINQDIKRDGKIDYDYIKQVMTPIIRTFVVRRTRQGIEKEYGSLTINGVEKKFPRVIPEVTEYELDKKLVDAIRKIETPTVPLASIYESDPNEITEKCKDLKHPLNQINKVTKKLDEKTLSEENPMYFVFQLILMLGFIPYRWMMYQTKYYGKTRDEIKEIGLNSENSKKLLLQLGIFGILRTVFLKRMESSVSALRSSLETYSRKLELFEKGIEEGKIVSLQDLEALEASLGDEDLEVDIEALEENTLDTIDNKNYELETIKQDLQKEKELVNIIRNQLEILAKDDSKIKCFGSLVDSLQKSNPNKKILVFSYYADTVNYLESTISKYSTSVTKENTGFVSSKNRSDAENLASRFSPISKNYPLKDGEAPLQYLFSTDVLSEGQNLQDAGILVNYDLHWNPVRMIQRNGRVNRLGSLFDEVYIYNMRPEAKLDSYLKLIQRLQGKIDIIRNTIGTDTPVLDEPENPIEYTDSVSDIYSADFQKRMQALQDAEKASDFLLSEDEFVLDLKKFNENDTYSPEYKESIYNISDGKWAVNPTGVSRGQSRPDVFGLTKLLSEEGELTGFQFTKTDRTASQLYAVSQLQALEWLRTTPEDNKRSLDKISLDKVAVKKQLESKVIQYFGDEETGSLIGQENEVLRILFTNGYVEEEIEMVRDAFKTKDVFYKRDISQLKRKVMTQKNKGDAYQDTLQKLVALAKDLNKYKQTTTTEMPSTSKSILFYINNNE